MDAGKIIRFSLVDGIHFDSREHAKPGTAVTEKVLEIYGVFI
jgi:hypothetical protein